MQLLLDKIKIELFVLNFQKVYSIFFLAAFSLTNFLFVWLIGGPSEAGALSNCFILPMQKFGPG